MTLKYLLAPSLVALTLSLAACNNAGTDSGNKDTAKVETVTAKNAKPVLGAYGIATDNMDTSVKPGDNFFKYVNGTWLKNTEIPADKSSYGSFTELRDLSDERVKVIIEEAAAKDAAPGSEEQKIGDFYAAFMDMDAINAAGLAPIAADLAKIDAVTSKEEVAALMGDPSMGIRAPVGGWVDVDAKDVDNYIFYMTQSGLGMPNRDYYLDEGEKSDELRAAYMAYLRAMLTAAGDENPLGSARKVMAFETSMARVHWTPTKRRNRSLTYNKMSLEELKSYAMGFPWDDMLEASGLSTQNEFVIRENDAIRGLAGIFGRANLDVLKAYMKAHYIGGMSAYLPSEIDDKRFAFYGKALRGTEVQQERWRRAIG